MLNKGKEATLEEEPEFKWDWTGFFTSQGTVYPMIFLSTAHPMII
jgi:hypothetical protein